MLVGIWPFKRKDAKKADLSQQQKLQGIADERDPNLGSGAAETLGRTRSCALRSKAGHWIDHPHGPQKPGKTAPLQLWSPPGCLLHNYQANDISACLERKKIVLVGDSNVRQLYWAIAKKMDLVETQARFLDSEKNQSFRHSDLSFKSHGVNLEFVWDPFLNTSRLRRELIYYNNESAVEQTAIMLVGTGHWFARFIHANPLKKFKDAIDNVVYFMNSTQDHVQEKKIGRERSPNLLLLAPIQDPLYDRLSPARAASITPDKISFMNGFLQQLSAFQNVDIIWSWALMTFSNKHAYEEGGLHVLESVAARRADTLLNLRCNAAHAGAPGQGFPYDRTCCTNYGKPGWLQWLSLFIGICLLPLLTFGVSKGFLKQYRTPSAHILSSMLVLAMVVSLCFYTDRTQIFNKTAKHFTLRSFEAMCGVVLALGVLSIRRSNATIGGKDQQFLSREQSEEWKGWMQFLILIYHYTGGSKVLWLYEIVRVLVASYLFMTGYGHAMFFLQKGDFSLRRAASTLIRLNLLSCLLPYVMRTDYMFYYFAPLVSFWFCIVYLTLFVGRSWNDKRLFLYGKILASATCVQIFHRIPGLLELVFQILKYTCRIHWEAREWRFRLLLDGVIVYVGMIVAVLYLDLTSPKSSRYQFLRSPPRLLNLFASIASLITIAGVWVLTRRSPDKYDYNWWHPYISCLPVLSFVILRNSNRHFRNFYSSIFAWLGRSSLETFTLQYHIWLAADTKGLLSLGLFGRRRFQVDGRLQDFLILTPIFLWISWRVGIATGVITGYLVAGGEQKAKRLPTAAAHARKDSMQLQDLSGKRDDGVKAGLLEEIGGQDDQWVGGKSVGWRGRFLQAWRDDLRVRVGSLLFVLWVLNLTYV
ncbi:MAG: hypothetical protein M1814_000503 [Vezdaea aestivalis]|nr:MAG: hypothetical protein M1814_000503 [Vezdaea aestivalis]